MKKNPPEMLRRIKARPYVCPKPRAIACGRLGAALPVGFEPPKAVKVFLLDCSEPLPPEVCVAMLPSEAIGLEPPEVAAAAAELSVVALMRVGFEAPHGWSE